MCNPAALVALMHDSDYDVLKEAFYYAWAKHISGTLADDENNGNVINDYYIPDEGSESSCDGEDSLIFGYAEPEKIVKFAATRRLRRVSHQARACGWQRPFQRVSERYDAETSERLLPAKRICGTEW